MDYKLISQLLIVISILILIWSSKKIILGRHFGFFGLFFCIYHILFYALPAIIHIQKNSFPFYSMSYKYDIILSGSIVTLMFVCCAIFGYFLCFNFFNAKTRKLVIHSYPQTYKLNITMIYFIIGFMLCLQVASIIVFGLDTFLTRRDEINRAAFADSSFIQVLFLNGIRGLSFICLMTSVFLRKIKPFNSYVLIIFSIIVFIIINYPISLSRFQFFSYILGFVFLNYLPTRKIKFILFSGSLIGVVTIFPFISYLGRGHGEFLLHNMSVLEYYSSNGDFDGFQSLLNVIQMTSENSFSYGYQLLGALLAFVPRVFWESKPEPTGSIAAEYMGYHFTNISSPLISELYVDLGYIGITIGAVLLGYLLRLLDIFSINKNANNKRFTDLLPIAILFSFLIILFRGALIAVISPLYIEITIAIFVLRIIKSAPVNSRSFYASRLAKKNQTKITYDTNFP
jgi:oligosaccharide repeat unit polymerase